MFFTKIFTKKYVRRGNEFLYIAFKVTFGQGCHMHKNVTEYLKCSLHELKVPPKKI